MATASSRSPAVKRLMKELAELRAAPSPEFTAEPLEDNLLEWHFTLRGPPDGGFLGGRYHGRLIFPVDYPFKASKHRLNIHACPPNISFLTPNGRFEVGKKICLSITGYHPESWRPAWGVRTALVALISFFPTKGEGAIGALDWSEEERRKCAVSSRQWKCSFCGVAMSNVLPDETEAPTQKLELDPDITLSVGNNTDNKSVSITTVADPTTVCAVSEPLLKTSTTPTTDTQTDSQPKVSTHVDPSHSDTVLTQEDPCASSTLQKEVLLKDMTATRQLEQEQHMLRTIRANKRTTLMQRLDAVIFAVVGLAAALILHKITIGY
ncbi:hypothetical protein BDEG_27111 [Batrachochytrium dendrobatidis JEL423]|uniref:UBC core domain-containing protein n=1 Tax=Batrachochytrium dendrobatidis (strain JEL423) TaxID=403673 RepID=A0A177WWF9_BATDL|nr:hypothetical protein BDEG_27111 [Batrachochytrium dendrobatidis JEL423]